MPQIPSQPPKRTDGLSTEYHKIETLYERDMATFKVKPFYFKNPVYALIKEWQWTEKIDGTNIRLIWDHVARDISIGGKTDNAQIHADLYKRCREIAEVERFEAAFPEQDAVIYGEGYGAGIQKGGGQYSPTKEFIAYDVFVLDTEHRLGGWWLGPEDALDVCSRLNIKSVPLFGTMTLLEATEMVRNGFDSKLRDIAGWAEGLVGRTSEPIFDKRGHRLIVKLKTKDF